jgi:hypothetical protein
LGGLDDVQGQTVKWFHAPDEPFMAFASGTSHDAEFSEFVSQHQQDQIGFAKIGSSE